MTRPTRRTTTIAITIFFALAFPWCLYSALAWVRETGVMRYTNNSAGKEVRAASDVAFADFNTQLRTRGVSINVDTSKPCFSSYYHYYHVTVLCLQSQGAPDYMQSQSTGIPAGLERGWTSIVQSLNVDASTHATSWHVDKGYASTQQHVVPVNDLFSFRRTSQNNAYLTRQIGSVNCSLSLAAEPAHGLYKASYMIDEACYKTVNYFGGWDCGKEHCDPY